MEFKLRLSTLLRKALAGEVSESRLKAVGESAATLGEAESLLSGSESTAVKLMRVFGLVNPVDVVAAFLTGDKDVAISSEGAWQELRELLSASFGGTFTSQEEPLRLELARHVMLAQLVASGATLPLPLADLVGPINAEQRKRLDELLRVWRQGSEMQKAHVRLMREVDRQLDLDHTVPWTDGLSGCFASPAIERLAYAQAVARLAEGKYQEALDLAAVRGSSDWVAASEIAGVPDDQWRARWLAIDAAAGLGLECATTRPPKGINPGQAIDWYVESAWKVDAAHRRLELVLSGLTTLDQFERPLGAVRAAYDQWLDDSIRLFTSSMDGQPISYGRAAPQSDIYAKFVSGAAGPIAYIWVDALRYELGRDWPTLFGRWMRPSTSVPRWGRCPASPCWGWRA